MTGNKPTKKLLLKDVIQWIEENKENTKALIKIKKTAHLILKTKSVQIVDTSSGIEINKFIGIFSKTINPTISFWHSGIRKASEDLIKKFVYDKAEKMALYAISLFGTQYAPVITNPSLLKEKLSQLMSYRTKENSGDRKGGIDEI